ncbi:hypothetical protein [Stenotrophomonas pavanii]|uniref:hypothetical protein n=2 Tax=Stenotrophomonas pavanii TaxID=487698 RepID=UPI002E78AA6A|nr:hypothetical protein [Stenotrophomonas pavanii]
MPDPTMQIDDLAREQAKSHPNSWVYAIAGTFGPNDELAPEAIVGAWKVDGNGSIIEGSFVSNPKYKEYRRADEWASIAC